MDRPVLTAPMIEAILRPLFAPHGLRLERVQRGPQDAPTLAGSYVATVATRVQANDLFCDFAGTLVIDPTDTVPALSNKAHTLVHAYWETIAQHFKDATSPHIQRVA